MKILITGINGFIGSWLAKAMVNYGYDVYGVDIKYTTLKKKLFLNQCTIEKIDILDFNKIENYIERIKPDVIIHLAAFPLVMAALDNPKDTIENNTIGTLNILELFRKQPEVKKLICTTSDKCYKNEDAKIFFNEDSVIGAGDPYSTSKAIQEFLCETYGEVIHKENRMIFTLRLGNVLGGGDFHNSRLVPDILKHKYTNSELKVRNGFSVRPWQNILDVIRLIQNIVKKEMPVSGKSCIPYNIGGTSDNREFTVNEIIDLLGIKRYQDYYFQKEKNFLNIDTTKVKVELGHTNIFSMLDTLIQCDNWYKLYYREKELLLEYTNELMKKVIENESSFD